MGKDFDVADRQKIAANARARLLDQELVHWRGDFYIIRDVSLSEKTGEIEVLYVSQKHGYRWTRLYNEMFESVDVGGRLRPRYSLTHKKMPPEER